MSNAAETIIQDAIYAVALKRILTRSGLPLDQYNAELGVLFQKHAENGNTRDWAEWLTTGLLIGTLTRS